MINLVVDELIILTFRLSSNPCCFILADGCCWHDGFKNLLAIGERTPYRNGDAFAFHPKHMGFGSLLREPAY
jgi:hypothetical protein